jgi:hypothetical protein
VNHLEGLAMETFGIVIWTSYTTGVVIIWCADGKRLAYASAAVSIDDDPPGVGDLVSMSVTDDRDLRRCTGLSVMARGFGPDLVRKVSSRSGGELTPVPTGDSPEPGDATLAAANRNAAPYFMRRRDSVPQRPCGQVRQGPEVS